MFTLDGIGRLGENLRLFLKTSVYFAFMGPNSEFFELNACGARGVGHCPPLKMVVRLASMTLWQTGTSAAFKTRFIYAC